MTEALQQELAGRIQKTNSQKTLFNVKRILDEEETLKTISRLVCKKARQEKRKLAPIQQELDKSVFDLEALSNGFRISYSYRSENEGTDETESEVEEDKIVDDFIQWAGQNIGKIVGSDVYWIDIQTAKSATEIIRALEQCGNEQWLKILRKSQ